MTDDVRIMEANIELLQERIAELELAQEDAGWTRLGDAGGREFSREGLRTICRNAWLYWLKNPLIKRGVEVQAHYVYGQGVDIHAQDEAVNEVIQAFMDDARNQAELTTQQAMIGKETELSVYGNLFFVFFVDKAAGTTRVRTIPMDEVDAIISDPEDAKTPRFYRRKWTQVATDGTTQDFTALYPDWRYKRSGADAQAGDVRWDTPVYHIAVNRLGDMRFGVSEVYAALDWAKAYKQFLEDWATLSRAYSRFAHKMSTPATAVTAAKTRLGTTYGSSSAETNPAPVTGATFIGGPGYDLNPIRIGGANATAEDGRRLLLMVAAGVGLPETFFGDASVGTVATATSLDRPTELKMRNRQSLWVDAWKAILGFVLEQAVRAGKLPGTVIDDDDGVPELDLGEVDATINVAFPPLLEHDVAATVQAIGAAAQTGATGGLIDAETLSRLLLSALGVDDIDAVMERVYPEGGESLPAQMQRQKAEQAQAQLDAMKAQQPGAEDKPPDAQPTPASEALMIDAVGELREAVAEFVRRHATVA